jgi:hypothetical protein
VASLSVLVSVGNAIGEPWAYSFAVAVALEVAVLAAIVRLAWTWPRTAAVKREPVIGPASLHG